MLEVHPHREVISLPADFPRRIAPHVEALLVVVLASACWHVQVVHDEVEVEELSSWSELENKR